MDAIETLKFLLDKALAETPPESRLAGLNVPVEIVQEIIDAQPDRNAKERYEDLCEYFKDCSDKGMGILGDRKEFKAWLERVHWHVVKCDELGRELEKLQSAQPEKRTDKRTETHACDSVSRQAAISIPLMPKGLRKYQTCNLDDAYDEGWGDYQACVSQLPSAQPEQQWIPCSERLPEKNVWVLVTFMMANGEVDIDIMRINRWDSAWETRDFDMAYRETVVAWMPLPEPYGGGQDD